MRIISGTLRGKKLHTFNAPQIRPTSDRMREAIFSILSTKVQDAVVLDLFAGTGALGIEALSRGARSARFIDNDSRSIHILKKNLDSCGLQKEAHVIRWDITGNLNCLKMSLPRLSLVFMDPPYNQKLIRPALNHLHDSGALKASACIVVEHSAGDDVPREMPPFQMNDRRKYGKNLVSFFSYVL